MAGRDIIVLGTLAGGVEALIRLVRLLPPGPPAALFVVCHFPASGRSTLPEILSRNGSLLASHARDGQTDTATRFDEEALFAQCHGDLILRHVLHASIGPAGITPPGPPSDGEPGA